VISTCGLIGPCAPNALPMAGLSKAAGQCRILIRNDARSDHFRRTKPPPPAIGEQGRNLHRGERREATTRKTPNTQPIHVGRHPGWSEIRESGRREILTVQRPLAATPVPAAVDVSASETTLKSRACQVLAVAHRPPEANTRSCRVCQSHCRTTCLDCCGSMAAVSTACFSCAVMLPSLALDAGAPGCPLRVGPPGAARIFRRSNPGLTGTRDRWTMQA